MKLTVVSPVYQAEKSLTSLVDRIKSSIPNGFEVFEIILIDDRSTDNSWGEIQRLCKLHKEVRGIQLSRNFGQHYAISAGLDYADGDWIVVMDCDLQDQPEEIPKLYAKAITGYDIVLARRAVRKDSFVKSLFSKLFYRTLGYLTGSKQDETIANFGIYSRKVVESIKQMKESIRYFPTMVKWVGFSAITMDVNHARRAEGTSNYNFRKLLHLAIDIILAYSDKPLRLTIKFGLAVSLGSFLFTIYTLVQWYNGDIQVLGYASLIISIWFLSGCLLITLGVVGMYVGKTFEGVKNRPNYIIDKKSWE